MNGEWLRSKAKLKWGAMKHPTLEDMVEMIVEFSKEAVRNGLGHLTFRLWNEGRIHADVIQGGGRTLDGVQCARRPRGFLHVRDVRMERDTLRVSGHHQGDCLGA